MTEPSVSIADLSAEIIEGRYDGHMVDIVQAVQARFMKSSSRKLWRIRFGGDEWTEESITLGEVTMVERALNVPWTELDPAAEGKHLEAPIAAHIAKRDGVKFSEALTEAESMTMGELLEVLTHYEKAPAPKD